MTIVQILASLSTLDLIALGLLLLCNWGIGYWIEHPTARRPSVTMLMADYRRAWMKEFARREARIFDATLVSNLRQSTAYFASTTLIAIGGLLAVIGNTAPLQGLTEGLIGLHGTDTDLQIRLIVPTIFLAHAFLKFVWSNRVFGYCAVMMGAVPSDPDDPRGLPLAAKAGELNIRAAFNFNRGLRSLYYAMGSLVWLISPIGLILGTAIVTWLLWTREFTSHPHDILSDPAGKPQPLDQNAAPK